MLLKVESTTDSQQRSLLFMFSQSGREKEKSLYTASLHVCSADVGVSGKIDLWFYTETL